jgi:cobalt-zinc-cadmium efflux system membrane fusion protein
MFSVIRFLGRHAPAIMSFAALGGLFLWGHHTGWRLAKPTAEAPHTATDHWCPEHHVPEDVCLLCRKEVGKAQTAQEPDRHRREGEEIRFAQVASAEALAKAGIRVEPVVMDRLAPRIRVAAETVYPPTAVARLSCRSAGVVREVLVGLGAEVAPGTVVAIVDASEVGQAKAALMQALANVDLALGNAKRARMTAAAGVRTAAELQDAESKLRVAEVEVFNAEQALRNLGLLIDATTLAGLDASSLALRLRRLGLPDGVQDGGSANLVPILAHHRGTVTDIRVVAGEVVEANTPIVVVADASSLWLSLPMPPERALRLATGQEVAFQARQGDTASGTVVVVGQAADPQTRLVPVWASIGNADRRLRVGQFGTAIITTGAVTASAIVPTGALQFDGNQPYVFVRRTETVFRSLPVHILARDGDRVAVDRLADGDAVAVTGTGILFSATFPERMGAGCTDGH